MSASTIQFASIRGQRVRFGLGLLAAALFAPLCAAPLSAQNAATTVSVDANADKHAINPNIYGVGMFMDSNDVVQTSQLAAVNAPVHRFGGDLNSTYNWQQDAWNLSNDWYWESFALSDPLVEGGFADTFITATHAANVGTEPVITVPLLPWIAKVKSGSSGCSASLWSFSVAKFGAQQYEPNSGMSNGSDPYCADAGTGVKNAYTNPLTYVTGNDPNDAYTPNSVAIQTAWINHLIGKWGLSTTSTGVKYYMLDNEMNIWSGTHRDVHPTPVSYDEEWNAIKAYAAAIKAADPNAIVIGPEEFGWWPMFAGGKDQANWGSVGFGAGSDYATHGNMYWYPYLLQQLAAYKQTNGVSLIDMLSVHCYSDTFPNYNQGTRMLWDPTFTDSGGWFADAGENGGIVDYIPTMQNWVKAAFPNGDGPQIGCTEYGGWGEDDSTIAGATVHADVLGIFGYYGFDMGAIYGIPKTPALLAFEIYRNYDGKLSTFGDTSVKTTVANPDNLSAFSAVRTSDGAMTVMVINKQTGTTPVTINLANFSNGGTAKAYQISSASQTSITSLGSVPVTANAISASLPGPSVTLYVIPAVTVTPAAPTNLTAAGGNGLVTLNWTAGAGATSYNVYRGTTAGGESATAIATDVTGVTYVDSTVTNGQIYYYVVKAVNSIGTSGPSNEASATPSASDPLFTATATASPNPATQGSSTTLTVKVTCTQNSMTNGSVSIVVLDPNGNVAQTTPEASQSFTNGQVQTYSPTITPTAVGTYTVQVNVSGSSGQLFTAIPSAGTFTVNAPAAPSFTITGSVSPTTISATGSTSISATFQNTGGTMTGGNIEIQIYPTGGGSTSIGGYAPQYNAWTIAGGTSQTLSFTFTPTAGTAAGTYNVIALAFGNNYSPEYNQATIGTLTIGSGGGGGTPAFTITGSVSPTTISATGSTNISATFQNTGGALVNGNLQLQVFNGTTAIGGVVSPYNATNVAAGASYPLTFTWTPSAQTPAFTTPGTYDVVAQVFPNGYTGAEYGYQQIGTITIQPAATTAPAAPTGLTATAGNGSVGLSWTASSGATSYNVYRGTTAGGESSTAIAIGLTSLAYTDTTVTNGQIYYYIVKAVNSIGASGASNEASATPSSSAPTMPTTPTNLKAQAANDSVALTWTASTNATSYNVYRGTATGMEGTTPLATDITGTTYTDSSAANGTTYYYEVAAVNGAETSAMSNEVSATPSTAPQFTLTATANPLTILVDESTNIAATVTCTANCSASALANATVVVTVWIGGVRTPSTYPSQNFNTTPTQVYNNVPAGATQDVGQYYIQIDVEDAAGNVLATNPTAGYFMVGTNLAFLSPATATPASITADGTSTVNFSITDVGTGDLLDMDVEIQMGDSSGNVVSDQIYPGQSFQPNQTAQTYAYNWTPSALTPPVTALGVYTAVITINNPQAPWYTNYYTSPVATDATVTIIAGKSTGATFSSTTAANPNPVVVGNSTTITSTFTDVGQAGLTNGTAKIYVVPPGGSLASPAQTIGCTGLNFTTSSGASPTQNCVLDWSVGSAAPAGTYTVEIGVYDSTGTTNYYWNPQALLITVGAPPATPTGLTATGGNAKVTLNWTASSGATSYNVYRGTTAGGESATPIITGITGTTFTDTTVTNYTTYYYTVAAVNSTGTSNMSNEASATPSAPPAAPTGLTATAGNASVSLSWTAVTGATGYNIYRGTTAGGEGTTAVTTVSTTSFTDSGLTNGTTYYYKVAAVNSGGPGALSNEASATPEPPVTSAPTGLTATAGNASVMLSWTATTGAASYNVYRGTTPSGESATPIATGLAAPAYTDTGLTNGQIYYYEVAAVDGGGTSSMSNEASATPQLTAPTAPTGLTATPGNASVTLTWTITTGATSYNVYRGTTAGGEGATPIVTGLTAPTYNDTGLFNGTTYYYKVAAVNSGGVSTPSAEASATPEPPTPAAPAGLTATAGNASVALSWTASSGATSYNVYRGTSAGGESPTAIATGVTTASYTDSTVSNGTTYYYKVAAVNASGTSSLSTEASATPKAPAPTTAPTGLTATGGNATVALSWTAPTGTTGTITYNVYRGTTAGGESATPIATNVATTTYTDNSVTNGTKYYYTVAAVNSGGTGPMSSEASATPQSSSSSAPNPPTGLTATAGNATVTLSWTAPTGTTGAITYNVYRGTAAGGESATAIVTGLSGLTYANTGLTNGTTYYFYVEAVSGTASSTPSNEASATPESSGTASGATFTLSASTPAAVTAGTPATSTITVSTTTGYVGTATISCALTSYPSGATDVPVCTGGTSVVTLSSGTTTGTTTVIVSSTASATTIGRSNTDEKRRGWAGGGAILALLLFFGIPARRRSWRSMLGVLVLMAALGVISGCSSNLGVSGKTNQGTTAGSYTFTVTGTGNPAVTPAPTTTFTLIVN
jgi:fibronectin type 3 domain-containing protein